MTAGEQGPLLTAGLLTTGEQSPLLAAGLQRLGASRLQEEPRPVLRRGAAVVSAAVRARVHPGEPRLGEGAASAVHRTVRTAEPEENETAFMKSECVQSPAHTALSSCPVLALRCAARLHERRRGGFQMRSSGPGLLQIQRSATPDQHCESIQN